jgi:outer membrane protein assembly factor BamA
LLVKNKIVLKGELDKNIKNDLQNYYKQRPNEKFVGLFNTKLYFHNLGSTGKKDNWVKRFFRFKLGEYPVLIDTMEIEATVKTFKTYLKTKGHYNADVNFEVTHKRFNKKKGIVSYLITPNNYYKFYKYELNIADKDIFDIVKPSMVNSFITVGNRFDHENMINEQERIVTLLRNNGYYTFTKDFIGFDTDTSLGNNFAYVAINIKNKNDYERHKQFIINDITISIEKKNEQLNSPKINDTVAFENFNYLPHNYELNPDILSHNLFLKRGDLFKDINYTRTYGRLNDLNIFRFINISTKVRDSGEVGSIDYNIKIIPSDKYFYVLEPQIITSDQNSLTAAQSYGIALMGQFSNRNIFRNAEILQLSLRSSVEAQGHVTGSSFFNATQQSLNASISIPRILLFSAIDRNVNFLNTKTILNASAIYELNNEYERRVATFGINYRFNKKLLSFYYSPLEFSFIRTTLKSDELILRAKSDIMLQNLFANNVIMDGRFGFNYSNKSIAKDRNYFLFRCDAIELAGNILTALNSRFNQPKTSEGQYQIFGVNYYQYIKSAIDFRYNSFINKNNSFVYRFFAGGIVPYGNSPNTPLDKRFYVGGASDLRAWSPRTIGPGSFPAKNQIDQTGDLKIEGNAEYRFNLYHLWLEGSLFADAGNIWTLQKDDTRPGANFELSRFYNEFAVASGLGVRLNFTIVLIRFDFGIPMHIPVNSVLSDRWVIKNISIDWVKDNLFFNFGIGYPF